MEVDVIRLYNMMLTVDTQIIHYNPSCLEGGGPP